MTASIEELYAQSHTGQPYVLVTLLAVRGSAPREAGTRMIVSADACIGSIGGGQLEFQCSKHALAMLGKVDGIDRQKFSLGKEMGQCCGGAVEVLFESMNPGCPRWL